MNFHLTRNRSDLYGIFGQIVSEDAKTHLVTLEHAFLQNTGFYAPAIPVGTYTCQRRRSPKFGYDVFQVMDVPGYTYIEIHIGNTNNDTDGCILLGLQQGTGSILDSRDAFNMFMKIQTGIDEFQLVVS